LHRLLIAGLPAHCERFWTLPGFARSSASMPASVRDQMPKP
jgi:hypothetical protein